VPKPGSDVAIAIGAPIEIAATDEATVEVARQDLERALAALEVQARAMLS